MIHPRDRDETRKFMAILVAVVSVLVTLAAGLFVGGCQPLPLPTDDVGFRELLNKRVPDLAKRYGVPGVSVAVVESSSSSWTAGYGYAEADNLRPVTPDTVFRVASVSKAVSAWGLMALVQEGTLDLDQPVNDYLSRWKVPSGPHDPDGVTIRRLLSHSAGVSIAYVRHYGLDESFPTVEKFLSGANGAPVEAISPPGYYAYSGGGYGILELLAEDVTGRPFAEFMQLRVLEPLRMNRSSFADVPDSGHDAAVGYTGSGRRLEPYRYPTTAAAGLYSTASDLGRFVAAMMYGIKMVGREVLSPESHEIMMQPLVGAGTNGVLRGLGYFIDSRSGTSVIGHAGHDDGWSALVLAIPAVGKGFVVLTNSDVGNRLTNEVGCLFTAWALGIRVERACP